MGQRSSFSYAVSVLRRSSGRGKSRKSGGLITLQLPDQDETFESAEVPSYPNAYESSVVVVWTSRMLMQILAAYMHFTCMPLIYC
jgi:hypothetical protein